MKKVSLPPGIKDYTPEIVNKFEYINDILLNWIHPIKNEIYPYLHLLKFLMQNTGSRDSNFIKRIRLKEGES